MVPFEALYSEERLDEISGKNSKIVQKLFISSKVRFGNCVATLLGKLRVRWVKVFSRRSDLVTWNRLPRTGVEKK